MGWEKLAEWEKARLRWKLQTRVPSERSKQLTPDGDWFIWLVMSGRGFGKTRLAAEDVSDYARKHPGCRIAGIFENFGEGRTVGVEGDSGLLSVLPPSAVQQWNRSTGELTFANGAMFKIYTAEKPGSLRGPQFDRAWIDELAKFPKAPEVWEQLMYALRLGPHPQVVVTTTPRPVPMIRSLLAREGDDVHVTRGSTYENEANLPISYIAELRSRHEGTRLGGQEIHGEMLDDFEGALWDRQTLIDDTILPTELPELTRIVVGVDPSTWGPELGLEHQSVGRGLETGIVACGITGDVDPHVYVIADSSGRYSPNDWAQAAAKLYRQTQANRVVVEQNIGPWVGDILHSVDKGMHVEGISARHGKRIRAEPVGQLSEQHRLHMVGDHSELTDQMCSWDPTENWSPDRIDALVHAVSSLRPWTSRPAVVVTAADHTL